MKFNACPGSVKKFCLRYDKIKSSLDSDVLQLMFKCLVNEIVLRQDDDVPFGINRYVCTGNFLFSIPDSLFSLIIKNSCEKVESVPDGHFNSQLGSYTQSIRRECWD